MQIVAKFYPGLDPTQTELAKEALEKFKRDVIAPLDTCGYNLPVIHCDEEVTYTYYPDGVTPTQGKSVMPVVKIDGYVHFQK